MEINSILSNNIKNLRDKFEYSQTYIANYLNITPQAYNQYENDARTIPVQIIQKLALLYNIEEIDLYEENRENQTIVTAFAFRAEDLTTADMQKIAKFRKIISNYINMSKALSNA